MSGEYKPTADERAWIEAELRRDPRLTEGMLTRHLGSRHHLAEQAKAEKTEAKAAGVSLSDWQQAKAEKAAADRAAASRRGLDRARAAVGLPVPPETVSAPGMIDVTRDEILRHRRDWQEQGGAREWRRLGCSEATFIRHRRKYGLVPWPAAYARKLTP